MDRDVRLHEDEYFHVSKAFLKYFLFIGATSGLLIHNMYLVMSAYPEAENSVAIPSMLFWVLVLILAFRGVR